MSEHEMKNAPPLYGWAIAIGAGAVAFGVSLVLIGIEGNGSVFIGAVVALVVGIIFTIAERGAPPAKSAGDAPTASAGGAGGSTASSTAPAAPAPAATPAASASAPATSAPDSASVAPESAPAASAAAEVASSSDAAPGTKPEALAAPVGEKDDLKQISGVGPVLEGKLNDLGVYHFWQIARWSREEVNWVDGFLNFKGRIDRDGWIAQASDLADKSASKAPA